MGCCRFFICNSPFLSIAASGLIQDINIFYLVCKGGMTIIILAKIAIVVKKNSTKRQKLTGFDSNRAYGTAVGSMAAREGSTVFI